MTLTSKEVKNDSKRAGQFVAYTVLYHRPREYLHRYQEYITDCIRDHSNNTIMGGGGVGSTICHTNFFLSLETLFIMAFRIKRSCLKARLGFIWYFLICSFQVSKHITLKNRH